MKFIVIFTICMTMIMLLLLWIAITEPVCGQAELMPSDAAYKSIKIDMSATEDVTAVHFIYEWE